MALRPSPASDHVLADWLSRSPAREDQALVMDVLRVIAAQERNWQLRYFAVTDTSDPDVTIFEPRDGLTVHIRLRTGEPGEFDLERILHMTTIDPGDQHTRDR